MSDPKNLCPKILSQQNLAKKKLLLQSLAEFWPIAFEIGTNLCLSIIGTPRSNNKNDNNKFANPVVDIKATSRIGILFGLASC